MAQKFILLNLTTQSLPFSLKKILPVMRIIKGENYLASIRWLLCLKRKCANIIAKDIQSYVKSMNGKGWNLNENLLKIHSYIIEKTSEKRYGLRKASRARVSRSVVIKCRVKIFLSHFQWKVQSWEVVNK